MRGLLKTLAPFAPDQSGVVSALYGLGGILVICDAGGCTGNICGFDEPRWFAEGEGEKNAIFSAGLRDMDAILGRDELLIEKLADAAAHQNADFAALIGTPVPAVIATDFDALRTMAKESTNLPVLTFPCTGTRLYDEGEREAYRELFRVFAGVPAPDGEETDAFVGAVQSGGAQATKTQAQDRVLGVLGCTPLDISRTEAEGAVGRYARAQGFSQAWCYGMGAGLSEIRRAGSAEKNLAVSPAGVEAAAYLQEAFGTPYEVAYPFFSDTFLMTVRGLIPGRANGRDAGEAEDGTTAAGRLGVRRILIVHQQVAANALRGILRGMRPCREDGPGARADDGGERRSTCDPAIVCGTWFLQIPALAEEGDVTFREEAEFSSYVENGRFDVVIGDPRLRRALARFDGTYIEWPHFAVSGILERTDRTDDPDNGVQ